METYTLKFCPKCNTDKNTSDFNKNKNKPDGLQVDCRTCTTLRHREYYKKNGEYHKKYITKQNRRRRKEAKLAVDKIKSQSSCKFCPEREICCLQFHHLENKFENVADMVKGGYSIKSILKEIEKCILVCSNCHYKLHAGIIKHI